MTDGHRPHGSAHSPRYASLDDYLRALRRRRWIIGAFALAGVIFGLAYAASRTETYTATASVSFRDVSQDLRVLGIDTLPETPPQTLAAINAQLIARPEVANRVARDFGGELGLAELSGSVSARVASRTGLVALEATWEDPVVSAQIANSFAEEIRKIRTKQINRRLERVMDSYRDQIDRLAAGQTESNPFGATSRITVLEAQISRLQTLRDIAEPVQIVDPAIGGSPNSLSTSTSGAIGGLIGLVLGLIAAFTRDALDRRVRNVHELHRDLGLPVLGKIPESVMGYPLVRQQSRLPRAAERLRAASLLGRDQRDAGRG